MRSPRAAMRFAGLPSAASADDALLKNLVIAYDRNTEPTLRENSRTRLSRTNTHVARNELHRQRGPGRPSGRKSAVGAVGRRAAHPTDVGWSILLALGGLASPAAPSPQRILAPQNRTIAARAARDGTPRPMPRQSRTAVTTKHRQRCPQVRNGRDRDQARWDTILVQIG